MTKTIRGVAGIMGTLLVMLGTTVRASTFYISPAGNDAWSGTLAEPNAQRSDGPVATPARARGLARAARGRGEPIRIELRGGTYYLNEPLVVTPEDSGTPGAPVTWSAYAQEHPVLSGGIRLTGWTHATINDRDAWLIKLPADMPLNHELWLDGKRLQRARWPKQGTLAVARVGDGKKHDQWMKGVREFQYAGHDLAAWPQAADGEAIVTNRWVESHLPIDSIDEKNSVIHFGKESVFMLEAGDRYWIENVRQCLTDPGEFYCDPREKAVYLIPPAGCDPNQAEVIAPRLTQVLRLEGKPAAGRYVEHLLFSGIAFSHAEWNFDSRMIGQQSAATKATSEWSLAPDPQRSGFHQAAVGVPGAIWGDGVRSCTFDRCDITHLGTYGIELARGCQDNRITHCTLSDLGAGGVKIGEVAVRDTEGEQSFHNTVEDCSVTDGGNVYPSCVAVWIGQSHDNTVAHNDIHGFWYTGISVGWTWGYGKSLAQRNTIEYNHIHHIGCKTDADAPRLSDMGGIYTLGNQEGTVIRFNCFHDIAALKYGGWGIYFDEGTTHIRAENNLVYRTTHGGFHQHYGKENLFRNNILAYGRDAQIQRSRLEEHQSFAFENNIALWNQGSLLSGNWKKLNVAFDHNLYWNGAKPKDIRFGPMTWAQWQQAGMDKNSVIQDPRFADPTNGDFSLPSDSKATEAGFKPFDLATVGPR